MSLITVISISVFSDNMGLVQYLLFRKSHANYFVIESGGCTFFKWIVYNSMMMCCLSTLPVWRTHVHAYVYLINSCIEHDKIFVQFEKKPFGDVLSWKWKQKAKEIATFSTESLFPITMVLFVLPVQIHFLLTVCVSVAHIDWFWLTGNKERNIRG